jgi:PmbA protein
VTRIVNSKGLELIHRSNNVFAMLSPVIKDGDMVNNASAYKVTRNFSELNAADLAKEAVDNAMAYIGAQPVKSGTYRIALRNDVASDILATFSGIFSADNVQKGMSMLKGKLGTTIASDKVTVIDDPLLPGGLRSVPFDAEGVAAYTKEVISGGMLKTFLYNLKTAMKDGVKTTGNAAKGSYASPVDTAVFNFYIKPGKKSYDEILQSLGDGILITELQGMHSGANGVSGDFSLGAKGFLIKGGKVEKAVDQITVAGNFYKVLEDVEEIGSDLRFEPPSSAGCFGSPTIILKGLSVAGS